MLEPLIAVACQAHHEMAPVKWKELKAGSGRLAHLQMPPLAMYLPASPFPKGPGTKSSEVL